MKNKSKINLSTKEGMKIYQKEYYQINRNNILIKHKKYYQKPEVKDRLREYLKNNKEKRNLNSLEWYKNNKEYHIEKVKERQKSNGYAYEKTPFQKKIRCIKRLTRMKYPLKDKKCEFCNKKALEHHHNTYPIKVDKFNYTCHNCHTELNRRLI